MKRIQRSLAHKEGKQLILNNKFSSNAKLFAHTAIKLVHTLGKLVSNAIGFTPENKNEDVTISPGRADNQIEISVTIVTSGSRLLADQIKEGNNGLTWYSFMKLSCVNSHRIEFMKELLSEEGGSVEIQPGYNMTKCLKISIPLQYETDSASLILN